MTTVRILADENITSVREHFAALGEVITVPGRSITRDLLADCDALLVRSVTPVDAALLAGTRCRFVASATSGTDHVKAAELAAAGIGFSAAPGCNAISVVDYVFSALAALGSARPADPDWRKLSFGVVGCGQIGRVLVRRLLGLGVDVIVYDPLLPATHPLASCFRGLEEVLARQVVSLHVPLTDAGPHATRHLLGTERLAALRPGTILINAARGSVVSNESLLQRLDTAANLVVVLDVWEQEPALKLPLLERVALGTPHIAGYSHEGKLRGTEQTREALCRFFGLPAPLPPGPSDSPQALLSVAADASAAEQLNSLLLAGYDIRRDDLALRQACREPDPAAAFDRLRKHYPKRHEYSHFRVSPAGLQAALYPLLRTLGFSVVDP